MLKDPSLWVAVAFIVFFVSLGKTIFLSIKGMLDDYINGIKHKHEDIVTVLTDAMAKLQAAQLKLEEAEAEVENIAAKAQQRKQALQKMLQEEKEKSQSRFNEKLQRRKHEISRTFYRKFTRDVLDISFERLKDVLEHTDAMKHQEYIHNLITNLDNK